MAYLLSACLTRSVLDDDGNYTPAVGYKSYFYVSGTDTPVTTWADADEVTPNANPVIHDSDGTALVYFTGSVRWTLTDPDDNIVDGWPIDGIDAPITVQPSITAWVDTGLSITRVDAVTFRVAGDYTDVFQPTRRVLMRSSGTPVVGSILDSAVSGGYTFVVVKTDDAAPLPVSILGVDVGILEAYPYAGPAPSTNSDLVINPHFYGWPDGVSFDITGNDPTHYCADCWRFRGPAGTGEAGTARFRTDRVAASISEVAACGSPYAVRLRCNKVSGQIYGNTGDSNINFLQAQRLYDALPWAGNRCVMELWALSLGAPIRVNPWMGFFNFVGGWTLVSGQPCLLVRDLTRFVIPFTLPPLTDIAGVIADDSSFFYGFDMYRGSDNDEVGQLMPKVYEDFDIMVFALHISLDESFGRLISYDDALDRKRRERYYFSSYPDGVAPGTANTDAPIMLTAASTTDAYGNIRWPMQMSKLPNVRFYAPQAGTQNRLERVSTGAVAGADISSAGFDQRGVSYIVSGPAALTAGEAYRVHVVADARY